MEQPGPSSPSKAPARFFNRISLDHLWICLPCFVIVVKGFLVPLPLLDFWWHLKMGEVIAQTHRIPRTDLFSFTASGQLFVVQNWLTELLYYFTYRLGGLPSLVFLNTVLLAIALVPILRLCLEATSRIRLAVLAAFLTSCVFFGNMRPQVFSFVLFSLFYWVLEGYRYGRRDRLWLLPCLMAVWVNLHGAFVLGLGLISLYLVAGALGRLSAQTATSSISTSQIRKLAVILALCLVATLCNPEGIRLYDYVRVVMTDQASQQFVAEWQPPAIGTAQGFLTFFGLFFLALLILIYSRVRPDLTDIALFVGFSMFGLTATRNTIWFGIVIAPILARHFGSHTMGEPRHIGQPLAMTSRINTIIAAVAMLVLVLLSPWVRPTLYSVALVEPSTPVGAIDYVQRNNLQGNIFHPQTYGDYLIWRLYPQQRSFIDGRVHLFGESFVRQYRNIFFDSGWQQRLQSFDIRYLLLDKGIDHTTDCTALIEGARSSPAWTLLFEDRVSVLFARRDASASLNK